MSKTTKSKPRLRLEKATEKTVLEAFAKALRRATKHGLLSASTSAGFVLGKHDSPRRGFQVFVSIKAWNEHYLTKIPLSGGIVEDALSANAEQVRFELTSLNSKELKRTFGHRAHLTKRAGIKPTRKVGAK